MHITCLTADLIPPLTLMEKVISRKPLFPVLNNVLLRTFGATLQIAATDTEIGLTSPCPAHILEPGAMTLPAKRLLDLVRAVSDPQITLHADKNGSVRFTSGRFVSRLSSLPAEDYPQLPEASGTIIEIPRAAFKQGLEQIRFAISDKEESRYYMKGALLELKAGQFVLVATDSARMAMMTGARVGTDADRILIPEKAIDELLFLLGARDSTAPIECLKTEQHLFFTFDQQVMFSRQIAHEFPAYERVLPTANINTIQIKTLDLIAVMQRHVLIADIVSFILADGTLDVATKSAEVGESTEQIAVAYTGPRIEIIFRGQYVLDFLHAATGLVVTLALKDAQTPALFEDGTYKNVVMGMRL